jgi:hypothetical protein
MTDQDNLPVWATILLGKTAGEVLSPTQPDEKDRKNSSSPSAVSSASIASQRAAMVFDGCGCVRQWKRKIPSSPGLGEAA